MCILRVFEIGNGAAGCEGFLQVEFHQAPTRVIGQIAQLIIMNITTINNNTTTQCIAIV